MLAGTRDPQEIIRSVKKGLYAVNFGGGQVDITTGKFVFSAVEAYMIEDGKVSYPVKGATLIGNGPDALTHVSMIGNDMRLDAGQGHLRQGRPERAGGRGSADAQDRRPHGGRHGLSVPSNQTAFLDNADRPGSRRLPTARCLHCRRTIRWSQWKSCGP